MVPTDAKLLKQARSLRKRSTDAENYLWYYLRAHRLKGYKFKRQVPIGNYIVDFVCIQRKLIVELDGGQHLLNKEYDKDRTTYFSSLGYKVLRFWNDDVLLRTGDVLESIVGCLEES
ncbi:TPA: endonuclease domain-containing protein [Legionella pneumophila]|nr:endonuclease domain-containing protein [Legionella pneumophila]